MGVCWTDDRDPLGRPAPGTASGPVPGAAGHRGPSARLAGSRQHRRPRRSAALRRPQAVAARITRLLDARPAPGHLLVSRRAYRRYWV